MAHLARRSRRERTSGVVGRVAWVARIGYMLRMNISPQNTRELRSDLLLIAALIALDVVARLLPHMPNAAPIAASALFAGTVLHRRALAPLVPLIALAISDSVIGFDGWRITLVTYAASVVPALLPMLSPRLRAPFMFVPIMALCSLIFFAVTNFGVWAFSGMYPLTFEGLTTCYIAALPFLRHTLAGDMAWAIALFGSAWIVRRVTARATRTGGAADLRRA